MDWTPPLLTETAVAVALLALLTGLADRRRTRRNDPDTVGLMPWRGLSIWASFAALVLGALALLGWIKG
jgi:hypothetical protein